MRIEILPLWDKHGIGLFFSTNGEIFGKVSRVASKILRGFELKWIHKNTYYHGIASFLGSCN
jgi:hypothetical protein